MYLYILSSESILALKSVYKIGCTESLPERLSTFLTGCPPNFEPSHELGFVAVWVIRAEDVKWLRKYEMTIHHVLNHWRMMRKIPHDCEWFCFDKTRPAIPDKYESPIDFIRSIIQSYDWCVRELSHAEINEMNRKARDDASNPISQNYGYNLNHIDNVAEHNKQMDKMQDPIIGKIKDLLAGVKNFVAKTAATLVAPCGSGKTRMARIGLSLAYFIIVCCPTRAIQDQWAKEFEYDDANKPGILFVGQAGTTDIETIKGFISSAKTRNKRAVIISTYISSAILEKMINCGDIEPEIIVLDEAHHMGGIVAGNNTGQDDTGQEPRRRPRRRPRGDKKTYGDGRRQKY